MCNSQKSDIYQEMERYISRSFVTCFMWLTQLSVFGKDILQIIHVLLNRAELCVYLNHSVKLVNAAAEFNHIGSIQIPHSEVLH